jgi:hypothetical protein
MNTIQESLSFDDVLIEPRYSNIQSRKNINIQSRLTKNINLNLLKNWPPGSTHGLTSFTLLVD